ncbi:Cullin-4A [Golovinomyces cichoracearum]|uniref:Cullin-4A n=1 Tax=Golovinomyces cichoracearum TaxID=62708 RepID=A0A420J1A9_9PEZI|nr:Cullin-4A [Golovinomyces cichoracearum]
MQAHENTSKDYPTAASSHQPPLKRKCQLPQRPTTFKRFRSTDAFSSYPCLRVDINKIMGKQPQQKNYRDLTRPLNLQPNNGAKRIPIKNLKTASRKNIEEYLAKLKEDLNSALTSIFADEPIKNPLELLCRGVEFLCRRGHAEQLFIQYRDRSQNYLEEVVLPQIEKEASPTHVETLLLVYRIWTLWSKKSTLLRSIYSFLDRSYLLNSASLPRLEDLATQQFRYIIFTKGKSEDGVQLGARVISNICDLVEYERTKQTELFDSSLLRQSIQMLHIFGIYSQLFEPEFLERSREFFLTFTSAHSNSGMKEYIHACDNLLAQETLSCDKYNFDSTTRKSLLDLAHEFLIRGCSEILLGQHELAKLIDEKDIHSLKVLYKLLCISGIQDKLKTPFERYVKSLGSQIVCNTEKEDQIVIQLLELKKTLDDIIRDAFNNDNSLFHGTRDSFSYFMNDSKSLSVWETSSSKVGEMIAKYIDLLLRGGLKAIPHSLITHVQEPDFSKSATFSSSSDEDAELDRHFDQVIELFRFIEGKDLFEAFYKKHFARRLLMARSASHDVERSMLSKLKSECGYTFTHNLEQMFKDQEVSRDEMTAYRQSLNKNGKPNLDLHVNILSAAAWPSYPDIQVNLPAEVARHLERFDRFYVNKHAGRRLTWKHSLAHSVIKAKFNKSYKELLVSAFQAIVLVLFNDIEATDSLSYTTIQQTTGLIDIELKRTLQSLACAKIRVLTKHPKGREINQTDTFTVNLNFTDPKYKIKINQIQLKETKEENQKVHEKVLQDRQYETQAAIVRIMKSRKTMTHSNLISEVIEQTKKRGAVEVSQIKLHIDKLIDKEYLERVHGGSYLYCA